MIEQIFLLHHTHVDLGYTDDRQKVIHDLVEMVDQVTNLTSAYAVQPEELRFRWIHEVSFPILAYARQNRSGLERHLEWIRKGLIELTALYVNPTELFETDSFEISIDYAMDFARKYHLPIKTAMFGDCPGIAWSVVDMLAQRGIKYLSAAPDFIMSLPLEVERPFWWIGPKGARLLVWFTDWRLSWYAEGKFGLRLHEEPTAAAQRLDDYCNQLEQEGYRWKGLAIHFAMDNEPPCEGLLRFVQYYNTHSTKRQIRLATTIDFLEYMEQQHGPQFETHRGAWPDWWANGNASAAFETSFSRRAKSILRRCQALCNYLQKPIEPNIQNQIWHNLLMFDEHTWGYQHSVSQPWHPLTRLQWAEKQTFALRAFVLSCQLDQQIKQSLTQSDYLVIVNPYNEPIDAVIEIPCQETKSSAAESLEDQSHNRYPGQLISWLNASGDMSIQTIYVIPLSAGEKKVCQQKPSTSEPTLTEKSFWQVILDKNNNTIQQILFGQQKKELLDTVAVPFAELIYETVAEGDRKQIYDVSLGTTNPQAKRPDPAFWRTKPALPDQQTSFQRGTVCDWLGVKETLGNIRYSKLIRIYHSIPRIDVFLDIDKPFRTEYESLYLTFPFKADKRPVLWIEYAGCVYRAGVDQLPGSATDWLSVGDFVALQSEGLTITFVPVDAPLIQAGDIHTGKWQKRLVIQNGHLYSWLMNNMWFTNFPAGQGGKMRFCWSIGVQEGTFQPENSYRFARSVRQGPVLCLPSKQTE